MSYARTSHQTRWPTPVAYRLPPATVPQGTIALATGCPLIELALRAVWVRVSTGVTTPTVLIEPDAVAELIT